MLFRPGLELSASPFTIISKVSSWNAAATPSSLIRDFSNSVVTTTFDPTLLISRAHLAGPGQKVVVTTELEKSRIKEDGVAAASQDDTFEIIVKGDARSSRPGLKRMDVPAQEVFHGLIEEKLQVKSTRVRKGN